MLERRSCRETRRKMEGFGWKMEPLIRVVEEKLYLDRTPGSCRETISGWKIGRVEP